MSNVQLFVSKLLISPLAHQRNANQSYSVSLSHTCQNSFYKQMTNASEDVGEREPLYAVDGNLRQGIHYAKQDRSFILINNHHMIQLYQSYTNIQKKGSQNTLTYANAHCNNIHYSQAMEPSSDEQIQKTWCAYIMVCI